MKITVLGSGTSAGVPLIACPCGVCVSTHAKDKRLRSSIHIEAQGLSIVIDSGPDFRQQMLRENIKTLDAIVFTHSHKDHVAGLDDVRAYNFINQASVAVYATELVQEALRREFSYIFAEKKYPGIPQIDLYTIDNARFFIQTLPILPIEVMHHRLPVLGFRIKDFTYITDANYISDAEKAKIKGSKILILNALRKEQHLSHFTLDQAVELAKELGVEQTYLTHISHQMGLHDEVNAQLPNNIQLAFDGLTFEL